MNDTVDSQNTNDTASAAHEKSFSARTMLITLALDLGLAIGAYYLLRLFGVQEYTALLVATIVAGLRMVWVAIRSREFGIFSAFLMLVFALGLVLSLVSGSPIFLLIKESFGTGVVGLVFLGSIFLGRRPLIYYAARRMTGGPGRQVLEENWETRPESRRPFFVMSAVWGGGLLLEALGRIPLVFALPVDVMAGLSSGLFAAVMVILTVWNATYVRRIRARVAKG